MKLVKQALLETWLILSIFIWLLNGLSLLLLPQMMWNWFNLIPIFVATSLNLGFAVNVFLNHINKLNKL